MVETVNSYEQIKNDFDLDYMRTEVQKIIDNHLEGDNRFSVMDYNHEELLLLIDLLTGSITWDEVENEYKRDKKELKKVYDEIILKYNYILSLDSSAKASDNELSNLKENINYKRDYAKSSEITTNYTTSELNTLKDDIKSHLG